MRQYAPLTSRTPPEALSPTVAAQVWARDALQLRYASVQRALLLKLLKLLLLLKEWLLLLLLLLKLLKLVLLLKVAAVAKLVVTIHCVQHHLECAQLGHVFASVRRQNS